MLNEANRLGVQVRLGCAVEDLDFEQTEVIIEGGERLKADVIVGADGILFMSKSKIGQRLIISHRLVVDHTKLPPRPCVTANRDRRLGL